VLYTVQFATAKTHFNFKLESNKSSSHEGILKRVIVSGTLYPAGYDFDDDGQSLVSVRQRESSLIWDFESQKV
jgi:hypothetical protein